MNADAFPVPVDASAEIAALIELLHRTEQRLESLTAGEVDAAADHSGRTLMRRNARDQLRNSEAAKQAAILNALPAHIALLDAYGTIVSVNDAWRQYDSANAVEAGGAGAGVSYLDVCDRARGSGAAEARQAAAGIRSVLDGSAENFALEYACHSPERERWFLMRVAPVGDVRPRGAVVMHLDVTRERQSRDCLRESERRFSDMLENVELVSLMLDRDARITYCNEYLLRLTGWRHDEVIGLDWFERFIPPDDDSTRRSFTSLLANAPAARHRENEILTRSGRRCMIRWNNSVLRSPAGDVVGTASIGEDITEQRLAAKVVRESEAHFRFLNELGKATRSLADPDQIMSTMTGMLGGHLRASRCAYADMDDDGERFTILHDYTDGCASAAGKYRLSLFGERAVATLNRGQTLVIRDVRAELTQADGADMFDAIGIQAIVTCPLVKDGSLRALIAVHQSAPRDWMASEVALVQEVVERCWATLGRRAAEQRLRERQALLRIAGRAARLGGWSVDLPEFLIAWSDEVCAIHELPPGTVPGPEQAFGYYAPQSREAIGTAFAACAEHGTPFDLELEVVTATGQPIWVRSIGEAQRNAAGAITRVQGAFQDVTERKRSESTLVATHAELLEASRLAGMAEVATAVLHNVGNVLNSVNVSAGLVGESVKNSRASDMAETVALMRAHEADLGRYMSGDPRGRHVLTFLEELAAAWLAQQRTVVREVQSLRGNIDHIKEIVAVQQGYAKVAGASEIVIVRDLVEDCVRMNESALVRHHVRVVREFEDVPPVTIEKHKVLQILVNLVRNAKQACHLLEPAARQITLRIAPIPGHVRITVSDDGVGIAPENLTRVFAHGFTTRKDGHGFGLHSGAIAAAELGGRLSAASAGPGRGATFTLDLPLRPPGAAPP